MDRSRYFDYEQQGAAAAAAGIAVNRGITAGNPGEREVIQESREDFKYRKLVLVNGRLAGAILMGYPLDVPLVTRLVKENADLLRVLTRLDRGDWDSLKLFDQAA